MTDKKNVVKSELLVLDIDRLEGSLSINLEQLKKVRSEDSRGYATYNCMLSGDSVAIAGSEDSEGNVSECQIQILISDSNKKSKGKGKSGKKVL